MPIYSQHCFIAFKLQLFDHFRNYLYQIVYAFEREYQAHSKILKRIECFLFFVLINCISCKIFAQYWWNCIMKCMLLLLLLLLNSQFQTNLFCFHWSFVQIENITAMLLINVTLSITLIVTMYALSSNSCRVCSKCSAFFQIKIIGYSNPLGIFSLLFH